MYSLKCLYLLLLLFAESQQYQHELHKLESVLEEERKHASALEDARQKQEQLRLEMEQVNDSETACSISDFEKGEVILIGQMMSCLFKKIAECSCIKLEFACYERNLRVSDRNDFKSVMAHLQVQLHACANVLLL